MVFVFLQTKHKLQDAAIKSYEKEQKQFIHVW